MGWPHPPAGVSATAVHSCYLLFCVSLPASLSAPALQLLCKAESRAAHLGLPLVLLDPHLKRWWLPGALTNTQPFGISCPISCIRSPSSAGVLCPQSMHAAGLAVAPLQFGWLASLCCHATVLVLLQTPWDPVDA